MDLKMISMNLTATFLLCIVVVVTPVDAAATSGLHTAIEAGGQAPPASAGGSSSFSVLVAKGLPQATAETLRDGLIKEGFTAARIQPGSDGKNEVLLGGLTSSNQANALMDELRKSGYSPESIIESRGGVSTSAAPAGESVYRVQVAEFGTAAEANGASQVLADEGFVNVDVTEENGKHLLMLGTFNNKADAEALLSDVNKAGFSLASVVSRQRLRTSGTGMDDADLTGLSASEQAQTRDVLAMAQKVESGDASAAEMKQLREMIQQLSSNQKAILGREESNRSADRDKLQRIFILYRNFDQAIKSRDYTGAEAALAEVKQIDPNDIFLANRLQVLERERSGGAAPAVAGAPAARAVPAGGSTVADPAKVQKLINEGRSLEADGKSAEALGKYRAVLAMDPTNLEARGKMAELGNGSGSSAESPAAGGLMKNKNFLYGAIGLIVLIIGGLWLKSRSGKSQADVTPANGATSLSGNTDFGDSFDTGSDFAGGTGAAAAAGGALAGAGLPGAAMTDFSTMEEPEEETKTVATPAPVAPRNDVVESEFVTLDGFDTAPEGPPVSKPQSAQPAATAAEDELVSINFEDETVATEAPKAAPTEPMPSPAASGSALDADLESLLKGTFPGASDTAPVLESAAAGEGVQELAAVGSTPEAAAAAHTVFLQSFDNEPENAPPADWRGEYDYATLSVVNLGEAGHSQCLKYEKQEDSGSATYHLTFPQAAGHVTAEFDIRCDEKNKFLLGVYLERDEDFKQSVHTIVHQLDPSGPASLRIQGAATPYQMGSWSHVRYEIDLTAGIVNGFVDNEQIVTDAQLAAVPDYVNTLSIRDNLATTGTLYLDNIHISEA